MVSALILAGTLLSKRHLHCLVLLILACVTARVSAENSARTAQLGKWRAMLPKIESALTQQGNPCEPEAMRVGPVDAADFSGSSFALVDVCPLGAYTELLIAMRLDAGQPVVAHFRKANQQITTEFARGASVMHGKDVKLVREKHAIYDISWDNDGTDTAGTVKLQKCVVDAYVWSSKAGFFDYDSKLTVQATRSYCRELQHQVH